MKAERKTMKAEFGFSPEKRYQHVLCKSNDSLSLRAPKVAILFLQKKLS